MSCCRSCALGRGCSGRRTRRRRNGGRRRALTQRHRFLEAAMKLRGKRRKARWTRKYRTASGKPHRSMRYHESRGYRRKTPKWLRQLRQADRFAKRPRYAKNPLSRRETAEVLSDARSLAWHSRGRDLTAGEKSWYRGASDASFRIAHDLGAVGRAGMAGTWRRAMVRPGRKVPFYLPGRKRR